MDKSLMSANFKKDYVAYSAIVIFFILISLELIVAIFIPLHLQSEDVWAEEVSRQEMSDKFDSTRNSLGRYKSKNSRQEQEMKILFNCMNDTARYLRRHINDMNVKQIREVTLDVDNFARIKYNIEKNGAYSTPLTLKSEKYLSRLLEKNKSDNERLNN